MTQVSVVQSFSHKQRLDFAIVGRKFELLSLPESYLHVKAFVSRQVKGMVYGGTAFTF